MKNSGNNKRVSRRKFLGAAGATSLAGPWVLSHSPRAYAQDNTLVVCTWGGLFQKAHVAAFATPFEKATGAKIRYVTQPSSAKIKAQVESGNIEWDVVDTQAHHMYRGAGQGWFEPLDYNVIDKTGIHPGVVHAYGIGSVFYGMVLGYNADKYPGGTNPRTWADAFDLKKFPGKRSFSTFVYRTMEEALLADGVAPDKLYPLDLDRALAKLDQVKNDVIWWSTGAQATDVIVRGEVDFGEMTNGHVALAQQRGVNIRTSWDGPAVLCNDMWCILKGSSKKDLAMQYIAYACQPGPQAEFPRHEPYGPVNLKAYDMLPEEIAKELPSVPGRVEKLAQINDQWWADNEAVALEKFNAWRLKN